MKHYLIVLHHTYTIKIFLFCSILTLYTGTLLMFTLTLPSNCVCFGCISCCIFTFLPHRKEIKITTIMYILRCGVLTLNRNEGYTKLFNGHVHVPIPAIYISITLLISLLVCSFVHLSRQTINSLCIDDECSFN